MMNLSKKIINRHKKSSGGNPERISLGIPMGLYVQGYIQKGYLKEPLEEF